MIHKITTLKNIGKFKNLKIGGDFWNGIFENNTVIYAPNGSGKTTLSLMFQSLSGNDELLQRKKTFGIEDPIDVKFIKEDKKEIKFINDKWNTFLPLTKVFNTHFIEENVYIINLNSIDSHNTSFELIIGEEAIKKSKRLAEIDVQFKKNRAFRKRKREERIEANKEQQEAIDKLINDNLLEVKELIEERSLLEKDRYNLSNDFKTKYLEKINYFLQIFNPNLQITQFHQLKRKMLFGIKVSEFEIRNEEETKYSLKYTLSEGDKNALAFSFFMADIELFPNLKDLFVVIDDPVTSFDYGRKNSTINFINQLSRKVGKLLILTHDLNFCSDLSRRLNNTPLNLKIIDNGVSSQIVNHDIETETMTGVFKDLKILNDFIYNGANTDSELREIVRCIRPVLEGVLRIKYYGLITSKEWLGDIIQKIKESDASNPFHNSFSKLDELIEINDYSKEYHHSNPYYLETTINPGELKNYVNRVIKLLREI